MAQDNPAHLEEAFNLMDSGDKLHARAIVIETLKDNPDLDLAWVLLSYLVDGPDQQRYALSQALRINPDNPKTRDLLSKLGDSHRQDRLQSVELEILRKSLTGKTENFRETELLEEAESCLEAGDLASARFLLAHILKNYPKNAQAWYLLSHVMRTYRGQVDALQQALERDPHHEAARSRLYADQSERLCGERL